MSVRQLARHTSLLSFCVAAISEAAYLTAASIICEAQAACTLITSGPLTQVFSQDPVLPAATSISAAGMSLPAASGSLPAATSMFCPSKQVLFSPTRQPLAPCNVTRVSHACQAKRSLAGLHHQQLCSSSSSSPSIANACHSEGSTSSSSSVVAKRSEHCDMLRTAAPPGSLAARQSTSLLTPAGTEPLVHSHPSSMEQQQHLHCQPTGTNYAVMLASQSQRSRLVGQHCCTATSAASAASIDTIAPADQLPSPSTILECPPELEQVTVARLQQQPTDIHMQLPQQQRHKHRMSGRRVTARYDIPLGLDWLSHMPDHAPKLGEGRLDVIMGPMFAGKTTALIKRVQQVSEQQDRLAVAVKSSKDERYGNHWVVTHDGRCMRCYTTDTLADLKVMLGPVYAKFQVLAIDEAQFFPDLVEFCQHAVDVDGKHVIVAGLSGDYRRQRFGQMLELMPLADSITQLKSQCAFCEEDALFSLRVVGVGGPQALVGGEDKYKATCRKCYLQHTTTMQ